MAYWWVNQNKTYAHEVGGGYLWSPKRTKTSRNQFYDNMTLVQPGDLIFSFADTFIKAVGVATGVARSVTKPKVFGEAGKDWSEDGWFVPVEFRRVEHAIRPKEHMAVLSQFLASKYAPLQTSGNGLQGVYLASITDEFGQVLLQLCSTEPPEIPVVELKDLSFSPEEQDIVSLANLEETTKATLVMARRGQGIFRSRVQAIESSCRVTGVTAEKFLIASHIKPWKNSDNSERLDGNNGLFLSPHIDRLFDGGFISFTRSGGMLVSPLLDQAVLTKWAINPNKKYGKFNNEQGYFLDYHSEELFRAN
jgi:hypothetical protein